MLFSAFIRFSVGLSASFRISSLDYVTQLMDFGFLPGGSFNIRLVGSKLQGAAILLIPKKNLNQFYGDNTPKSSVCGKHYFNCSSLSFFPRSGSVSTIWNDRMPSEGIYTLVIINCAKSFIDITVSFKNSATLLDSRESLLPTIFTFSSFADFLIGFSLFINSILNMRFCVSIQTSLTAVFFLRQFSMILSARRWIILSQSESCNLLITLLSESSQIASDSTIFALNSIAALGWGTIRANADDSAALNFGLLFFGHFFCSEASLFEASGALNPFFSVLGYGCPIVALAYFYSRKGDIESDSFDSEESLRLKEKMNSHFRISLFVISACFFAFWFIGDVLEFSVNYLKILEELLFVSIGALDLRCFWYSNEKGYDALRPNKDISLIYIEDPKGNEMSIASN